MDGLTKICLATILAATIWGTAGLAKDTTAAKTAPMVVPGGELDPGFAAADVYQRAPTSATAPATPACRVAERYVALINAGKYADVAQLYADDATFLEPIRPNLQGRSQIDAFYTGRIGSMQPQVVAVTYLGNDRECMIELALQTPIDGKQRYVLVSVDHFIVNERGKITSMTAYARPMKQVGDAR